MEKSYEDIYHSPRHVSVITRKHPNNNNKICPLPYSSCFQQHFMTDSMYLGTILILERTLLLLNFNYIRDLTNRRRLFSILVAEYASFSHKARTLKTKLLGLISNIKQAQFASFSDLHMYLPL